MRERVRVLLASFGVMVLVFTILLGSLNFVSRNTNLDIPDTPELDTIFIFPTSVSSESGPLPHDPLFTVKNASNTSLLRDSVVYNYNGRYWENDKNRKFEKYTGDAIWSGVAAYKSVSTDIITITQLHYKQSGTVPLLTSLYTTQVNAPDTLLYNPDENIFYSEQGTISSFTFQTNHYSYSEQDLINAGVGDDKKFLFLPSNISKRTYNLAQNIVEGITSPYLKAKKIEQYLKNNYTYDLDYTHAPLTREPVDWFLFEEKKGGCANFNSAFVVLARIVGLPARLVSGYAIHPWERGEQIVYADQAHAWAEIKFKADNTGMIDFATIEFDATGNRSNEPDIIAKPTITEITYIDSEIQKEKNYFVKGKVITQDGVPVDSVPVEIFINTEKVTYGGILVGKGSTQGGTFDIEIIVPTSVTSGTYQVLACCTGNENYLASWSDPQVKVVTGTLLFLQQPSQINLKESTYFSGSLTELSGKSIINESIDIFINDQLTGSLVTDVNGSFAYEYTFIEAGDYSIKAVYDGNDNFSSASSVIGAHLIPPPGTSPRFFWLYLAIGITIVAIVGTGSFILLRIYKKRWLSNAIVIDTSSFKKQNIQNAEILETKVRLKNLPLIINFPQIEIPYPDVWGAGDDLQITCRFTPGKRNIANASVSLVINDSGVSETVIDGSMVKVNYKFINKGIYKISLILSDDNSIQAHRGIRIVDYREEIVNLFKEFIDWSREKNVELAANMTPRDIEYLISTKYKKISKEALDTIISCFEEVNYSLHPIRRGNYETMYKYLKIMMENERNL